ncbi:MAG: NB-ARC domain-containing protein [Paracoccaceae bacterium]
MSDSPYIGVPTGWRVVGREVDLVELYGKLAESGGVQVTNSGAILAGQGGIGKSTLARAYAEEYRDDYAGVLWLTAGTRQAVIDGLMGLCGPLGLAVPEAAKEADAQAVLAKLAARGDRWLVIYDNVEGYDDFKGLEPRGAHLIVTTRQGTGWPGFAVMKADVLKFDTEDGAAVRLLMEAAERTEDAAGARALAEVLGGLPLALVMAGRLIAREGGGFDDYRRDVSAIIARAPRNEDYPTSVIGAVRLSYARLSENARLVADLFAWWAAEGLAARLIADAPGGEWWEADKGDVPAAVQALAGDAAAVRAAMAELADRSLIAGPSVDAAMHRMTAAALRAMQGDDAMARAAAALLDAVYPGGGKSPAHSPQWPECRRLTPHVRAVWETGAAPATAAMDTLLNQAAIYLGRIADFPGALEMARGSLMLKQARLPEEDRDIALGHGTLGMALMEMGDLPGALAELDRAEALLQEAHELWWAVHEGNAAHPEVRNAAGWLVHCLLVRARAGENRGAREAKAKRICAEVGLDFETLAAQAADYPYTPGGTACGLPARRRRRGRR